MSFSRVCVSLRARARPCVLCIRVNLPSIHVTNRRGPSSERPRIGPRAAGKRSAFRDIVRSRRRRLRVRARPSLTAVDRHETAQRRRAR